MSRILDVYLCDNFVGTLTQDNSGDLEFAYDQGYVETRDRGISLSLPSTQKRHKGKIAKAFDANNVFETSLYGCSPIRP